MTEKVHMTIGSNIGYVLLDIAQTNLQKGEIQKALDTFTKSFIGLTEDHALMILKNEAVIVTNEDGTSINLVTDEKTKAENAHNILDWKYIIKTKIQFFEDLCETYSEAYKQLTKLGVTPTNYNIVKHAKDAWGKDEKGNDRYMSIGTHNLLARVLADNHFSGQLGDGEGAWLRLCDSVEYDSPEASKLDKIYYWLSKYVWVIRQLHKNFVTFCNVYEFLETHKMINHYTCIENTIESICIILEEFCNPNEGYYHPMCNEQIHNLKKQIKNDMLKTNWGTEYLRYGILEKNIEDGYDAGYLAPDGTFYGSFGSTSSMIHMTLADNLFKKKFNEQMTKDGVSKYGVMKDPEQWLIEHGWMKIHDMEVYGYFKYAKNDNDTRLYCPTPEQVNKICVYADKCWSGNIYTRPQIVERTEPIKTYKLKQMDEFKLHEIFEH